MGGRGSSSSKTRLNLSLSDRVNFIPSWFYEKNMSQNERYIVSVSDKSIERETEKAILIKYSSDYGTIKHWVPKSIVSDEAIKKQRNEIKTREKRKKEGLEYNSRLKALAKENGIKVRDRMKTQTIIDKLKSKGVQVPGK